MTPVHSDNEKTGQVGVGQQDLYQSIWGRKLGERGCSNTASLPGGSRYDVAASMVLPAGRLLDIGCGDGSFAKSQAGKFKEIYGVDISDKAVQAARANGVIARELDTDRRPLPFEDGFFDLVTSLDTIEHVVDPLKLVKECVRVLRPGGRIIIATPNTRYLKHLLALVFTGRSPRTSGDKEGYDGGHLHYFTTRDIEELLKGAGFRIIARSGIIPSALLSYLRPFRNTLFVREFLSAGFVVLAQKKDGTDELHI